ncbi:MULTISPECIES: hypothetical protein [Halorussus]|uniref:hypothetical protein n=1 Tax=Halorussus TaxID=1070314 RepID=UPI00209EA01B|nr:hypothetical protein [Halorussus vallis]USZ75184.1 hypothetical protein NGM07_17335 [Halorussus vallis]
MFHNTRRANAMLAVAMVASVVVGSFAVGAVASSGGSANESADAVAVTAVSTDVEDGIAKYRITNRGEQRVDISYRLES